MATVELLSTYEANRICLDFALLLGNTELLYTEVCMKLQMCHGSCVIIII